MGTGRTGADGHRCLRLRLAERPGKRIPALCSADMGKAQINARRALVPTVTPLRLAIEGQTTRRHLLP